ncbi:antigen receptor-like protein (DUF565) [Wolffia australiana]
MIYPINNMGAVRAKAIKSIMDLEFSHKSKAVHRKTIELHFPGFSSRSTNLGSSWKRRLDKGFISFALNTGGAVNDSSGGGGGGEDESRSDNRGNGQTRLGTIVRSAAIQFLEKVNASRKNFPTKIFLLLLGFYTANALATILGQTGDWDVLVAGIVVAAIEGIGMLMYRRVPAMRTTGRLQSFVELVNFWKAGVCLGLFVDAFKLGS